MENLLNLQDQYKFPMGQFIHEQEPDAEVTFRMTNRKARKGMRIANLVSVRELQEYYDELRKLRYTPEELAMLEKQQGKNYSTEYLGYLAAFRLPEIRVSIDSDTDDLTAETTGPWNDVSQWEIPMLQAIPELYYPRLLDKNYTTLTEWCREGNRRGDEFIGLMKTHDIKFAEFGTRRRASSHWQDHMVERFVSECPEQFIGTSNPWLAAKYNVPAIGTNAHELSMVFAALEEQRGGNPLDGQTRVIQEWLDRFPSMPVALIDTFTSDVTLHDMTRDLFERVESFRIDSGVEEIIGAKVIRQLLRLGIDPKTKSLMFTNSLTGKRAVELKHHFEGEIGVAFGIGGGTTNNMSYTPSLNIVSKAVAVNGYGTVKLSDDEGKHMGNLSDVARYQRLRQERLQQPAQTEDVSAPC
ncbi:hypothetical protein IPM09_00990 [Candidatus Saccharibacteria bacterium]|nr:MAG: hypothetical protein IPM09_00990 [Candidatus Saccharibacteria bacterium]